MSPFLRRNTRCSMCGHDACGDCKLGEPPASPDYSPGLRPLRPSLRFWEGPVPPLSPLPASLIEASRSSNWDGRTMAAKRVQEKVPQLWADKGVDIHKKTRASRSSGPLGPHQRPSRRTSSASEDSSGKTPPLGPSLRTAARKQSHNEPAQKPGESPEDQRARPSHNRVEKEYRIRLYKQFKLLPNNPRMKVRPSQGDAVLVSALDGGRRPEIVV